MIIHYGKYSTDNKQVLCNNQSNATKQCNGSFFSFLYINTTFVSSRLNSITINEELKMIFVRNRKTTEYTAQIT